MRLPNLVIAGVAKAGTTSLFNYLARHPDVCGADVKELRYFTPLRFGEALPPVDEYAAHFAGCGGASYAMEATPGYFSGGRVVAEGVNSTLPGVRVVVCLRDPAERCWSWYRFVRSRTRIPKDMGYETYLDRCEELRRRGVDGAREHQAFLGLSAGCYADWLDDWAEIFADRLRLVFFDHLAQDPAGTVAEICEWLRLDPEPLRTLGYQTENKTEQYRYRRLQQAAIAVNNRSERFFREHPGLKRALRRTYYVVNRDAATSSPSAEARARVADFYRPYNERLARQLSVLGYDRLPLWLAAGD